MQSVWWIAVGLSSPGLAAPQERAPRDACAAEARYVTADDPTGKDFADLKPEIAIPLCEAALAADPADHGSRANLARALSKAERDAEALAANRIAAEAGNAQAQRQLALHYQDGRAVGADPALAFQWMKRAADAGYVPAFDTLGSYYGSGTGTEQDLQAALRWVRRAADAGDRMAINNLGAIYENGEGVEKDPAEAARLYRRAAAAGVAISMRNLGSLHEEGAGVEKNLTEANRLYRMAADAGDAEAMRYLASNHRFGLGVEKDMDQAIAWYRKAIEAGDLESYSELGALYEYAEGERQDPAEAVKWYRLGSEAGEHRSTAYLASMYAAGTGVAPDLQEARRLYLQAAEAGDSFAMRALGEFYFEGRGVARDYVEGNRWFQKASDAGDLRALVQLAQSYRDGQGFARDEKKAVELYRRAHEQGEPTGTVGLAGLIDAGRGGLTQDVVEAARLYRQAAEGGYAAAMRSLANLYYFGSGVPLDYEESRRWETRAAESGDGVAAFMLGQRLFEGSFVHPVNIPEARRWLTRARALGQSEAAEYLVRATLADATLSDRSKLALQLLKEQAEAGHGWAIAALAHPGAALAQAVAPAESAAWREKLQAGVLPKEVLLSASEALKSGRLARQELGLALAMTERAGAADPFAAQSHQIRLLLDLKLFGAALRRYEAFVASDLFKNAGAGQRTTFEQEFGHRLSGYGINAGGSLETFRALAESGVAGAAYALGNYYKSEDNSEQDLGEARFWYVRAAELGSAPGMLSAGYSHSFGLGGPEDKALAFQYYRRAAEAGLTTAKNNVGYMYLNGEGVPKDEAEAYRWFSRAAEEGELTSNAQLALARFRGEGTAVDSAGAMDALWKAIDCAFIPALPIMAQAHFEGSGVARDPAAGWRWMRYAASRTESSIGALGMAQAAALGWGGVPDVALARTWLIEARRRGDAVATKAIEVCGEAAGIACLRGVEGFVPRPLMEKPRATRAGNADPAVEEAALRNELARALAGGAGEVQTSIAFSKLDRHYQLHSNAAGLIRNQLLYILSEESRLERVYGSRDNYFGLFDSSCRWGTASRLASSVGRPEAAVLFAKVAVNRLQQARQRIADLDDDVRECFIAAHRDRYRELIGRFLELGRFEEAENVLAMLKDFEFQTYAGGAAAPGERGRSFDPMPLTAAQARALQSYDDAARAFAAAQLTRASGGTANTYEGPLARLADAVNALEEDPRPVLEEDPARPPRVQAMIASLPGEGIVAVQAVVQPDRVYWLITTRQGQKVVRVAAKLPELAQLIRSYREALSEARPEAQPIATEIYNQIFAPVDAELKAARAEHVLLSLDDMLRYVPFAALHDGQDWLVRRYAFSMFRDTNDLLAAGTRRAAWEVAGFGVTKDTDGLGALPMVADELQGIIRSATGRGGVLPGTARLDEQFDRAALTDALGRDYEAVHIASHFVLDASSRSSSYLLLGNGDRLPLDDFRTDTKLRFGQADFLALSACQTALSARDASGVEVDSLAEIAQDAGAPAVLASLWNVADASTPALMVDFYRNRNMNGLTKAQALRQAQLALMTRGAAGEGPKVEGVSPEDRITFDHPFFWAPFVMLGDSL